jgi:hypothetical protein
MGQEETAFVLNAARSLRHSCGKRAVPLAHLEHFLIQTGHLEKARDRYVDMREPRRSGCACGLGLRATPDAGAVSKA